jgi:hypothetical protein
MFWRPVVFDKSEEAPRAVLQHPVVLACNELLPTATFLEPTVVVVNV